jgi:hypothetical protein
VVAEFLPLRLFGLGVSKVSRRHVDTFLLLLRTRCGAV